MPREPSRARQPSAARLALLPSRPVQSRSDLPGPPATLPRARPRVLGQPCGRRRSSLLRVPLYDQRVSASSKYIVKGSIMGPALATSCSARPGRARGSPSLPPRPASGAAITTPPPSRAVGPGGPPWLRAARGRGVSPGPAQSRRRGTATQLRRSAPAPAALTAAAPGALCGVRPGGCGVTLLVVDRGCLMRRPRAGPVPRAPGGAGRAIGPHTTGRRWHPARPRTRPTGPARARHFRSLSSSFSAVYTTH